MSVLLDGICVMVMYCVWIFIVVMCVVVWKDIGEMVVYVKVKMFFDIIYVKVVIDCYEWLFVGWNNKW